MITTRYAQLFGLATLNKKNLTSNKTKELSFKTYQSVTKIDLPKLYNINMIIFNLFGFIY